MKRFLLAPLIIALGTPALAGLPDSITNKWVRIESTFMINTEDIDLNGSILRFLVERIAPPGETQQKGILSSYEGKLSLNCDDFTFKSRPKLKGPFGSYYAQESWKDIKRGMYSYRLANYFCFLTGVEGYTREESEPKWATKIIKNVQTQESIYLE